jgi:hydrogenase/urease accessory protein HupE
MRKWLFASPTLLLFEPTTASAHVVWQGGGAFWTGFLHPITSVDQVCFLLALSIWLNFNEPQARLWSMGVVVTLSALTAIVSRWSGREFSTLPGTAALMIIAGLGGAIRIKVHDTILVTLAAAGACLIGIETGKAVGVLSPGAFIIGASLSPFILLVYLLGGLERLRSEWQAIACRAVASWIAAIGIMMLTFELWQPHFQAQRP